MRAKLEPPGAPSAPLEANIKARGSVTSRYVVKFKLDISEKGQISMSSICLEEWKKVGTKKLKRELCYRKVVVPLRASKTKLSCHKKVCEAHNTVETYII